MPTTDKEVKNKIIITIFITVMILYCYWTVVVRISTEQNNNGNLFGWKALAYRYSDQQKSDSLFKLRDMYWNKSDNTLKLIPKFLRP